MSAAEAHIAPLRPLWSARRWWLALLLILLLGAGLRYTGYNFSLPYIDHPDEPNHNLAARMIVDWGTARPLGHDSYPPGIVALNYISVRLFQDPAQPPATVIRIVLLISVTTSVVLLVLMALFGYHMAGSPAGLLAAAMWAVTPAFVTISRLALPDIFVSCLVVLSLWLTLAGILYQSGALDDVCCFCADAGNPLQVSGHFFDAGHFAGAACRAGRDAACRDRQYPALCTLPRLAVVVHAHSGTA